MFLPVLGTIVFFFLAPVTVAGWIPYWISGYVMQPPLLGFKGFRIFGVAMLCFGIPVLLDSFARFAVQGRGTPAPMAPTQTLVVSGLYRFVRNPMYVAVVSTIFGQALLFGSLSLLLYGGFAWLATHLFVISYEEPTLRAKYGAQYDAFTRSVPRWIPRLHPRT